MKIVPSPIQRLIQEFNKLPGIGSKTSERFVYYLLRQPKSEIQALANQLQTVSAVIRRCNECYTYTEAERCVICSDPQRDRTIVCVVAEPKDVVAIEKTGQFNGLYHVLGGVINHTFGIGPQHLRIEELVQRVEHHTVTEVIIATNPDMEGETTALYISKQLENLHITITKMARGLPMGADIEFADEVTLGNALQGRQQIQQ